MATVLVLLVGVLATIAISHYYFRRTVSKRLSIYLILRNRVLAGIDDNVRQQLKFYFGNEQVTELFQIEFIVANDGERAVSSCIEPLSLRLPTAVKLLDSSILHRNPTDLRVQTDVEVGTTGRTVLKWKFPLLNKGEFFLVKLLLNADFGRKQLRFHILADDLPRTIESNWLPPQATRSEGGGVEWTAVTAGTVFLAFAAGLAYCLYAYAMSRPWMLPFPWGNFRPSWIETPALALSCFGFMLTAFLGGLFIFGLGLEGFFRRHPKFPLPSELRSSGYRLMSSRIAADAAKIVESDELSVATATELKQPLQASLHPTDV